MTLAFSDSLAKLCTKNYENPSIFVKVTAKKSVTPLFSGHGVLKLVHCCKNNYFLTLKFNYE